MQMTVVLLLWEEVLFLLSLRAIGLIPQTVYVDLPSNDVVQGDSEATILHRVSGADYGSETAPDVVLKLTEFGFVVTDPTPVNVPEGESAEYSIRLASQPVGDVVVSGTFPSDSSIVLSIDRQVLTFTTGDWSVCSDCGRHIQGRQAVN